MDETNPNEVGAVIIAVRYDVRLDEEVFEEDCDGDELEACITRYGVGLRV